jgi:hypothetical protein
MHERALAIQTLDELREYVTETLCERYQLDTDAFPMTEQILVRAGTPCGIYFCLHGPRSVKVSAIWETDRNTILFYDSSGERFDKIQLAEISSLELTAA